MSKNDVGKYDGWTCSAIVFSHVLFFWVPWKRGKIGKTNKHTKLQTRNRSHFHGIWCFQSFLVSSFFCCMKKPSKKKTNAYLPSALLCESRFPELLSLMGKTGNASFEEKTKTTFLCSPGPGPCPWSYTNMCSLVPL